MSGAAERYTGLPMSLTGTGALVGICEERAFRAQAPHGHGPAGLSRFRVLALTWTCSREGLICTALEPVTRGVAGELYSGLAAFSLGVRGRWVLPRSAGIIESQQAVLAVTNTSAGPIRILATLWLKTLGSPATIEPRELFAR